MGRAGGEVAWPVVPAEAGGDGALSPAGRWALHLEEVRGLALPAFLGWQSHSVPSTQVAHLEQGGEAAYQG